MIQIAKLAALSFLGLGIMPNFMLAASGMEAPLEPNHIRHRRVRETYETPPAAALKVNVTPNLGCFADYLRTISIPIENEFAPPRIDPDFDSSSSTAQYKNIVICFDNSGSTKCKQVSGGGRVRGRMRAQQRRRRAHDQTKLDSAQEDRAAEAKHLDPAQEDSPPQTKHIALAQAEGLAVFLQNLSRAKKLSEHKLYLLGFSTGIQLPNILECPHVIKDPDEYTEIAHRLDKILPYPEFNDTVLAPALEYFINDQSFELGDTLMVIVTDGTTFDPERTGDILATLNHRLSERSYGFDIFTIGAGSILNPSATAAPASLIPNTLHHRKKKFVTGSKQVFRECNIEYLQELTNFANGRKRYAGAFQDYRELDKTIKDFMTGQNDGTSAIYVQIAPDQFKLADPQTRSLINTYFSVAQEKDEVYKTREGILVYQTPEGYFEIKNEEKTLKILVCSKNSLHVSEPNSQGEIRVTSEHPEVQAIIRALNVAAEPVAPPTKANNYYYYFNFSSIRKAFLSLSAVRKSLGFLGSYLPSQSKILQRLC